MASSMSWCSAASRNVRHMARQWYAHAAGLFPLWLRLSAPWAAAALWAGPRRLTLLALPLFLVGPLSAGYYSLLYVWLRRLRRLPLRQLKRVDSLLLALSPALAALTLSPVTPAGSRLLLAVPGAGLLLVAWVLNWQHEGLRQAPGDGVLPPAPAFAIPVHGPITAGYRSYDRSHTGIDVGVPEGTAVYAPADGQVVHAGPLEHWGHTVILDHGAGWSTLFAHLDRPALPCGVQIRCGALIGWSGSTGISTGPHVHVELRYRNRAVDPSCLVSRDRPPCKDWVEHVC